MESLIDALCFIKFLLSKKLLENDVECLPCLMLFLKSISLSPINTTTSSIHCETRNKIAVHASELKKTPGLQLKAAMILQEFIINDNRYSIEESFCKRRVLN